VGREGKGTPIVLQKNTRVRKKQDQFLNRRIKGGGAGGKRSGVEKKNREPWRVLLGWGKRVLKKKGKKKGKKKMESYRNVQFPSMKIKGGRERRGGNPPPRRKIKMVVKFEPIKNP